MRLSRFHVATAREVPADAEIASHRLMLRTGMIRKLASGLYTWSPLGLRVLKRVEAVVREEMQRIGAIEMLMPAVQPAELWQETGRWDEFGGQLLKMHDRKQQAFCFGPTHEEVITDFARHEIKSYKQLPLTVFQIQTKFRDEIRPRFGVMRAREFLMKDAYSFHLDAESLDAGYQQMHGAYSRVCERLGLDYRPVAADTGAIGGSASTEFHVLADSGEDAIVFSDGSDYAANIELATSAAPSRARPEPQAELHLVETPGKKTIDQVCAFLDTSPEQCVKTIVVRGQNGMAALCLRGDHQLNLAKAAKLAEVGANPELAAPDAVREATGVAPGSVGPVGLAEELPVIVDRDAAVLADFACGGNQADCHYVGANWLRDARMDRSEDLRDIVEGDPAPDGNGHLHVARGIEVGHIFQLGDKYAKAMGAAVLDKDGKKRTLLMGCYGIGVSRLVAAAIEQNHDDKGICWPESMAPWQAAICLINPKHDETVTQAAEQLQRDLQARGVDTVIDDRGLRPGAMFSDIELIGIPHRIVVSPRGLKAGTFEYRRRDEDDNHDLSRDQLLARFD